MLIQPVVPRTRILQIEGVGTVLMEKSRKSRYINIRVRAQGTVRVSVPYGASFSLAEEFVRSKISWIAKHQKRMERIEALQPQKQSALLHINRPEAKKILTGRLHELAGIHGFNFNKVFLRNQRSRWGSCSAKNNINLNLKLMLIPEELRDYVLLHELVHTRIKSHSPKFWQELGRYIDDPQKKSRELRRIGGEIL